MCVCILYFRRASSSYGANKLSLARILHGHELKFSSTFFFCARSRFVYSFVRTADELCMEKVSLPHRAVSERTSPILTWQECSLSRAWKSVTCKNCENSSSRAQLGWGDDTMNDDDLCSCNFKNKFHHPLTLPVLLSSLLFHALSIVAVVMCRLAASSLSCIYAK